jgi:hypothetical protein
MIAQLPSYPNGIKFGRNKQAEIPLTFFVYSNEDIIYCYPEA